MSCVMAPVKCPSSTSRVHKNVRSKSVKESTQKTIAGCRDACKSQAGICAAFEYYPSTGNAQFSLLF